MLLSDEATTALDPETTRSILELLRDLNRELGLTVLLITHEMAVVEPSPDEVAVIEGGRIVEQADALPSTVADRLRPEPVGANGQAVVRVVFRAAQTPRSLDDVDAAAVNTNYATPAGLKPGDAILREDPKGPYVNLIAVRAQDKDKPWVKSLVEVYRSPEVKAFIEKTFGGAVLASW